MLVPGINCPNDCLHYTDLFSDEEIDEIQCNMLGRVLQPVKKLYRYGTPQSLRNCSECNFVMAHKKPSYRGLTLLSVRDENLYSFPFPLSSFGCCIMMIFCCHCGYRITEEGSGALLHWKSIFYWSFLSELMYSCRIMEEKISICWCLFLLLNNTNKGYRYTVRINLDLIFFPLESQP